MKAKEETYMNFSIDVESLTRFHDESIHQIRNGRKLQDIQGRI